MRAKKKSIITASSMTIPLTPKLITTIWAAGVKVHSFLCSSDSAFVFALLPEFRRAPLKDQRAGKGTLSERG